MPAAAFGRVAAAPVRVAAASGRVAAASVRVAAVLPEAVLPAAGRLLDRPLAYSVTQWGHREGLPSSTVYSIAQTPDGFLWLGTADGLLRFDGSRFVQVPLQSNSVEAFGRVRAVLVTRDGQLWAGTEGGNLVRLQGGSTWLKALHSPVKALREQEAGAVDALTAAAHFGWPAQSTVCHG